MASMNGRAALLIIDVQFAFFDKRFNVYVYQGEEFLSRIKALISRARKAGVPVIYVQHDGANGTPWEPGTPGWPIHPDIAPREGELVTHKPTPDSFHRTTLQAELDSRGIRRLIVAGIQSDWCIDTTVRRAYSLEYDVTVVEELNDNREYPRILNTHNRIFYYGNPKQG